MESLSPVSIQAQDFPKGPVENRRELPTSQLEQLRVGLIDKPTECLKIKPIGLIGQRYDTKRILGFG
ncbi:hypothetical protein D9M71_791840 [compost metagenome]